MDGWIGESIEPALFEIWPEAKDLMFSEGGPKEWFVVVKKVGVPSDVLL